MIDRLRWDELFAVRQPVDLELGSGDGSFLSRWAQINPGVNFLGVERLLGRLKKLDRKGLRLGLSNLRILRFEAAYLMQYLLPEASLQGIHVYFPDPWPKRRHQDRRLVNASFVEQSAIRLQPGGVVWLRTDSVDYFAQMVEVFSASCRFRRIEVPEALAAVTTDFERDFNARGIPTNRAGYEKVA